VEEEGEGERRGKALGKSKKIIMKKRKNETTCRASLSSFSSCSCSFYRSPSRRGHRAQKQQFEGRNQGMGSTLFTTLSQCFFLGF